jgi:hypothetical protein
MRLTLSGLTVIAALASGCVVVRDPGPGPGNLIEPLVSLGPTNYPGYRVLAGAATSIPGGEIGYLVTANGQGGYRVTWTDTINSPAQFSGTITVDGTIDKNAAQTHGFSGQETLVFSGDNQITFTSIPGNDVDGVDLVSSTDPIYLDAKINGSHVGVNIFFTGATTRAVNESAQNPVAFTSP